MAPFVTLLAVFAACALARLALKPAWLDLALCGRIAMAAMLVLTGISHFFMTEGMEQMLPPWVPAPTATVYLTGLLELLAAVGLLVRPTVRLTGWCLILFFLAVLPANVHAALHRTGVGEHGPEYLWFRIPLQALFIAWVWWFSIRRATIAR